MTMAALFKQPSPYLLLLALVTPCHCWITTTTPTKTPSTSSSSQRRSPTALCSAVDPSTSTCSDFVQALPQLAPNSRRVILLRHGETAWNAAGLLQGGGAPDLELNAAGRRQASQAARALQGLDVGVLASSHLERSAETADLLRATFPSAVRCIHPKFAEMKFGGAFEGRQIKLAKTPKTNGGKRSDSSNQLDQEEEARILQNKQQWQDFQNNILFPNPHVPFPDRGESIHDVERRAQDGLNLLLKGYPDVSTFCIVAHGRINKLLLRQVLGLSSYTSLDQGNACINVLDVNAQGEWVARVLNHVQHVQDDIDNDDDVEA